MNRYCIGPFLSYLDVELIFLIQQWVDMVYVLQKHIEDEYRVRIMKFSFLGGRILAFQSSASS